MQVTNDFGRTRPANDWELHELGNQMRKLQRLRRGKLSQYPHANIQDGKFTSVARNYWMIFRQGSCDEKGMKQNL